MQQVQVRAYVRVKTRSPDGRRTKDSACCAIVRRPSLYGTAWKEGRCDASCSSKPLNSTVDEGRSVSFHAPRCALCIVPPIVLESL